MKILLDWLKDYVAMDVPVAKLTEDLALVGIPVEAVEEAPNNAGTIIELEITTNRPDLLGYHGVAREVAALYSQPLKSIQPAPPEAAESAAALAQVEIAEPDLCHRYVALVLRNIKVQPSPDWLRQRLEACGVASINNIVDVTNYVLLELGHPTHAFDLDLLGNRRIIVRRAQPGEKLTTLDGVERALKPHHLLIADASRPVALAGIMGGADSEINFSTRNVLLESAWFEPIATRRAAKDLGLRTEASHRFERGMDVEAPLRAARRCAQLFLELAGGELLAGAIDVYPRRWQSPQLTLRRKEILRILGAPVPDQATERILAALGFTCRRKSADQWSVTVPSFRRDVTREIDLIEEIARHHGYDKFPAHLPTARQPVARQPHARAEEALRQRVEGLGFDEAVNFSPVDPTEAEKFLAPGRELVRISKPLSQEASVLRPTGLLSLAKTVARNVNRGQRDVRFYEIGKTYAVEGGRFRERRVLTLAATGQLRAKSVYDPGQTYDFFALKGALETALEPFALDRLRFQACDAACFHPAYRATVFAGEKPLGVLGQLAAPVAAAFKLRQPAYLAELDLEALYAAGLRERRYQPLSRFPAVERDFSLVLDPGTSFGAVRQVIEQLQIPELVSVVAVDRFRGQPLPQDKYSLLVRAIFQSSEQTLAEEQVRRFTDRIVAALAAELGATLRTS